MLGLIPSNSKSVSKWFGVSFVSASLMLSACAKKDDAKAEPAQSVPTTLAFSKPTPGERLTTVQAQQIKRAFSNKPSMILPPGDLVFVPKDMTPAMKAKRESELRAKDANAYDLLKQVQAKCAKARPTSHFESTFPVDGDEAKNSLRSGDYFSFTANAGLAGGFCPVDIQGAVGYSARVDERDLGADTGKASGAITYDARGEIKDPRFAQMLGARGLLIQSSMSGLVVAREVSAEKAKARTLIQMNLNGSYLSLDKDIPFSSSSQFLINDNGGSESVMGYKINMGTFSFSLDLHSSQASAYAIPTQEIFLNGYPTTQAELNALFGNNNPGQISETTASFLK